MRGCSLKRSFLPVTLLLLVVTAARAQTACPWLTQGTAAAYLGGDVTVVFNSTRPGEGVCRFTQHQNSSFAMLEITVSQKRLKGCPRSAPTIKGVGSHAVACHAARRGKIEDIITGSVRDTNFTVRLVTRKWPAGSDSAAHRSSIVEQTAEEVAGNLF